jgi:hypothetical protein
MVELGLAVTEEVLELDKPVVGDQEYVLPPEAVKVTLPPTTIVYEEGETVIVGMVFTVTDTATF